MSSSIWTRCAGASNLRPLSGRPWRVVEAQHVVSTRRLVDSREEQILLEEWIDRAKPKAPSGGRFRGLHYLLATPFRYPPLRHGSRFASRFERGLWYGSDTLATAFAETAYYRLLFLEGTTADLGAVSLELNAFRVQVATAAGIDLTGAPFARFNKALASPSSYRATQALGTAMRAAGVDAFRCPSARDPEQGGNWGLFTPQAFRSRRPTQLTTWHSVAERSGVEFTRKDYFKDQLYRFPRGAFLVRGRLPAPAP